MIKKFLVFNLLIGLAFLAACDSSSSSSTGSTANSDTVVSLAAIPGVTAPVYGATPVTSITATAQYTGTVTWSGSPGTFAKDTVYTATITLTAQSGYTFTGVDADFFTVADADSVTNTADTGVITAVFPATVVTFDNAAAIGDTVSITIGSETADLNYVSDGTSITFPTGENDNDSSTLSSELFIARTETTYALWYEVYTWATDTSVDHDGDGLTYDDDGDADYYTFYNAGREGNDGTIGAAPTSGNSEPVSRISWRDAVVWCNALTEYYNDQNDTDLTCVYYTDSDYATPLRTSTNDAIDTTAGTEDNPYIYTSSTGNTDMASCAADGFRLPATDEWEYAARYIGATAPSTGDDLDTECVYGTTNYSGSTTLTSGYYWTPGDYASGATDDFDDTAGSILTEDVAWYTDNSSSTTHNAAQKTANALELYDMSGNVWEWCFDWNVIGTDRVRRGGGYSSGAMDLRAGFFYYNAPYYVNTSIGFRFAKSAP